MNLMLCMTGEPEQLPFLPEIAALGAGIELGSYGLVGIQSAQNWETRLAQHAGVRARFTGPLAVHGPFLGMEFAHLDHLVRAVVQQRLDMTFEVARQLKAIRVVLHSGFTPEVELFKLQDSWLSGNIAFWRAEICRWSGSGIEIVLENDTEQEPDWILRLVNEVDSPALGLCLDIGHQHVFSELGAPEWVRRMGNRLFHVHLHDNAGARDSHLPLGRGTIDFEPIYAALTRQAPRATISLEVNAEMDVKMGDLRALATRFAA